jgi:DUF438 domain-containing protein
MKDKLLNSATFFAGGFVGGFTVGSIFLLYKFLKPKDDRDSECSSCAIKAATTSDESTHRTKESTSVFNQSNIYVGNNIGTLLSTDINLTSQELNESKNKSTAPEEEANKNLVLLKKEIEDLKKDASTYKTNVEKKFDIIFKYIVQTNLEQCDTITWINPDLSAKQRKEMLDSLQSKVLEEAEEISKDIDFKINIPESSIVGHHFEAIE